uniref:Uncharacterized protein n=1 Tax=Pygocentrus nattereri TaxID=42514 RepID=A0AAR2LSZ1_PYGNA
MGALKVLSIVFVVLHVADAAVIPCTWTQFRLRDLNEESIMLLEKMGASLPLRCLEEGWRALPDDVFLNAQNEDLALVALETLRGVDRIFQNEQTSVTWDRETLGLFKNIISSRQVENLQKCKLPSVWSIRGTGGLEGGTSISIGPDRWTVSNSEEGKI